jgi:hypothetical protein
MKAIFKFEVYVRRCLWQQLYDGIFVADKDDISNSLGKDIDLEDDVCTLKSEHFRLITDNADIVKLFEDNDCEAGINPLEYIRLNKIL